MRENEAEVNLELHRAHSARMYDYYLGGVTNFAADREAVGQVLAVFPWVETGARANRAFVHRSTRALAAAGIDQFLDVGTGIPTSPNLHEVAQEVNPQARIVYVDNDPIVLAHAQALLRSAESGRTTYVEADATDPEAILKDPGLLAVLDLSRPVALSLNALLHFVPDSLGAYDIVARYKNALAPGSALVVTHVTPDFAPAETERLARIYIDAGTPAQVRTRDEVSRFFDGWQLLDPGVVPTHRWRPEQPSTISDRDASAYAGVALKPA